MYDIPVLDGGEFGSQSTDGGNVEFVLMRLLLQDMLAMEADI